MEIAADGQLTREGMNVPYPYPYRDIRQGPVQSGPVPFYQNAALAWHSSFDADLKCTSVHIVLYLSRYFANIFYLFKVGPRYLNLISLRETFPEYLLRYLLGVGLVSNVR